MPSKGCTSACTAASPGQRLAQTQGLVLCRWGLGPMAQKKKQLVAEGKLDKHGRPNENTPKEYLRALPDLQPKQVGSTFRSTAELQGCTALHLLEL